MDAFGCGVCKSPTQIREATREEADQFWLAKGIDGAVPEGLEVRSLVRCSELMDLPNPRFCECQTAWVRNAPEEEWRAIVRLPRDFVASVVS
ncbi:MAG: hypothetical protein M3P30_03130 [Chloroflexota bacterium]|nr:hypothetical protein [Chloroflexota bacterium]